ncbi:MAG: hypothetical protein HQK89_13350 [Nitrospirae bacterium]|nr:hypothetical protein [Nitrospirota bacterium]
MDKASPSLTGFFERHPGLAPLAQWAGRAKLLNPYFPFILLLYTVTLYYMATLPHILLRPVFVAVSLF